MKRLINYELANWKASRSRKPLLMRGARQVGKTHAVRELGKQFTLYAIAGLLAKYNDILQIGCIF